MTARSQLAQMVTRLEHSLKERLKKKAKAAGRTLNAEVVYRLDVEGRLQADLAAGRVPEMDAGPVVITAAPPAAVVAITPPAPAASQLSPEMAELLDAFDIVHDLYEACTQDHADVVIPSRLGKRAQAFVLRHPRAAA